MANKTCIDSVKYESPYSQTSIPRDCSQSPSLKRRQPDQSQNVGDKRQRTGLSSSPLSSVKLAACLAEATACATQPFASQKIANRASFYCVQSSNESGQTDHANRPYDNDRFVVSDPQLSMRILCLPMLDSLSTQILSMLVQVPYNQTIRMVNTPESEFGQRYATLKSLFEQTKNIYFQQGSFLSADSLYITEFEHRETIRRTNLATFVSNIFCAQNVGFLELNNHFVDIFTEEGAPLKMEPGELFLNLKTQMYLSVVSQEQKDKLKEDILEDFFQDNIKELLESRHPDQPLSYSEVEFLVSFNARRQFLADSPVDFDSLHILSDNFSWEVFLQQLGDYLSREPLLENYLNRHSLHIPVPTLEPYNINQTLSSIEDDLKLQAELAAKATLESLGLSDTHKPQLDNHSEGYSQTSQYYQPDCSGNFIPKEQTAPTQVLYERARQAAVARVSPSSSRRSDLPSQRRPWSGEEERALMAGLDQVKGPHWSQILALYGIKGTINEILKDRNQVQLKDKARNLKLFFLKNGIEVPYYLKAVTGELKTRAPTQAAKREAEERARIAGEEEQIRMNGVMALAGGLHQQEPVLLSKRELSSNPEEVERLNGMEEPYYLEAITGELKAHVPTQAAKQEAEERARIAGPEEQIRMNGVMALAGGLHQQGPILLSKRELSSSTEEIERLNVVSSDDLPRWHGING